MRGCAFGAAITAPKAHPPAEIARRGRWRTPAGNGMSVVAGRSCAMTADQAQAAPALLDLDLAAIGLATVPDILSPIDGVQGAGTSLDLGLDHAAAPSVAAG